MIGFLKNTGIIFFVIISFFGKACFADAGNTVVKKNEENLFVTQHVSSSTLFVNEQALHTILFCRKVKTINVSLEKPLLQNFKVEDLKIEREYEKIINGTSYLVTQLHYAIFPVAPGIYKIPSVTISCDIIVRSNKLSLPFSEPEKKQRITISSIPVTIKVVPLPEHSKPAGVSELVGLFSINGALNKNKVTAGESVTLTTTLTGKGNLYELVKPVFPEITGCRIYHDQPDLKINRTSKGISGIQTYKMAIVPIKSGLYTINPVSISFFDPKAKKYREIFTNPLQFEAYSVSNKKNRNSNALISFKKIASFQKALWGLVIIFVTGCMYYIYLRRQKCHKKHSDNKHNLTVNALNQLMKNCKTAASTKDFEKIHKAFKKYIADKTKTSARNLTATEIEALLFKHVVSKELTCKIVKIFNDLDTIRFSRKNHTQLFKTEIIQNIVQTALELEQINFSKERGRNNFSK